MDEAVDRLWTTATEGGQYMSDRLRNLNVSQIRALARDDAEKALAQYWPFGVVPVDPLYIAQAMGATVFNADLDADTWGMLVGTEDGASIYLDRAQATTRYRFSCAHEVGHLVDRGAEISGGMAIVERRNGSSGRADEIYANEFAGSLLMPRTQLLTAIQDGEDNFDLAERFNVSYDAVSYRRKLLRV